MKFGMYICTDPIQSQDHRASEVPKIALFKVYLIRHLQTELTNDH